MKLFTTLFEWIYFQFQVYEIEFLTFIFISLPFLAGIMIRIINAKAYGEILNEKNK